MTRWQAEPRAESSQDVETRGLQSEETLKGLCCGSNIEVSTISIDRQNPSFSATRDRSIDRPAGNWINLNEKHRRWVAYKASRGVPKAS